MIITRDNREQNPYTFRSWDVEIRQDALPAGDYSLAGFEDRVAVERKNLDDLVGCFMGDSQNRFEKVLTMGPP